MLFSSISFIYFFLPIILVMYYITPRKFKNMTLLVGSLVFYFIGEPVYTLILVFSTIVDYSHSKLIVKNRDTPRAKVYLLSSILINLSMLMFFKYADFIIMNINTLFNLKLGLLGVKLPIGISFFTFQTMSYTIDVYRGEEAQNSIISLGTYVALFPQLIAGPIVRYKTISQELMSRKHSVDLFSSGIRRFVLGLSKKVLIANTLGELITLIKEPSVISYWMIAIAYALQIYYDFSGYSDMAIGLGRMFGFKFMENFNYPYISRSITEFWQRWHISLGMWFRDYVYIPLGGNRGSKLKVLRNIMVVWLLTGVWHGASWNFIIWGLYFASLLVLEKIILKAYLIKLPKFVQHIYVLFIVLISFVIFRNESMTEIILNIKGMFGLLDIPLITAETSYYLNSYLITFIIAWLGATPVFKWILIEKKSRWMSYVEPIALVGLILITTGYLVDASFNPFLYFRF